MSSFTSDDVRKFLLNRFSADLAAACINPSDLGESFDLLQSGIVADSFGLIEMISAVEQQFNITVDFESMDPAQLSVLSAFSRFVAQNAISKADGPMTGVKA